MRPILLVAMLAAPVLAERAVRRTGEILEGGVTVSMAERRVTQGKKVFPFEEFHLVEQDDGRMIWAPDFRARLRGYEVLAAFRARTTIARVALAAAKAGLPDLAASLLAEAAAAGLPDDEGRAIEKEIAKVKAKSPAQGFRDGLERDAAAARGLLPRLLIERAQAALAEPEAREGGLRLLREALLLQPDIPEGRKLLEAHAPSAFPLGDARFWLDWHLDLELLGARTAPEGELELNRARSHWRPDLYGLVSSPVLLITPLRETRVVGRCLAYGRLACETLAAMFATDQPMKRHASPLTIMLYTDHKEYRQHSGAYLQFEDREFLEHTVGHYSPGEQVSRFFWYADPGAERRIIGTCVHELTHHWLEQQCPRYAASQLRRDGNLPGHWIVEGFATFMEEGRYSAERRTADLFNPRSYSLDVVQSLATAGGLIEWSRLYAITGKDFVALSRENKTPVIRRWSLRKSLCSERRIFYKQAGATCAYLFHAEGGALRPRLIDFVIASYTGQSDKLDPRVAFGMAPEELGGRVVEFARRVASGWKP